MTTSETRANNAVMRKALKSEKQTLRIQKLMRDVDELCVDYNVINESMSWSRLRETHAVREMNNLLAKLQQVLRVKRATLARLCRRTTVRVKKL